LQVAAANTFTFSDSFVTSPVIAVGSLLR
jgi:hypothetical protein